VSTEAEAALLADMASLSDNQLIDHAAHYNALLKRGRLLEAQGAALVRETIGLFTICQNELHARIHRRIEHETDREDRQP
jgi:hypothetical protein